MKVSVPLLTDEELLEVDKNWQYLVDKYMMMTLKEKDQLIAQYVMKKQKQEIERLTAESTKWESKFYDEAKKVDKAIEYIKELTDDNESIELMDISFYVKNELLNILQGSDKE